MPSARDGGQRPGPSCPGTTTGFGGLVMKHRCCKCLAADAATRGSPVEHVRVQVGGVALHEAEQRGSAGALPGQPEEPQAGHREAAATVVAGLPGLVGDRGRVDLVSCTSNSLDKL
jgi:hypothetical protein